jgi:hypothetical protein
MGEQFLLYVQYNYLPMDAQKNALFASLVNSWIDTQGSKIVDADPLKYAITFYNEQFELPTEGITA